MPMRSAPTDSILLRCSPADFTLLRCSPTDFTDLHRLSGCVVSPTEFHSAEIYSHRFHRFTQIVRVRSVSHRISQMYGAKKSHRFHSAEMFSHRFHRFTQIVWARSVSHRIHRCMVQKKSHRFHRARRSLSLKHLCNSVKSVGVYLIRSFCEFGVFCGSTSQQQTAWGRQGCRSLLRTMRVLCR